MSIPVKSSKKGNRSIIRPQFSRKQSTVDDHEKIPFVCTETYYESHDKPVFGVAFNQFLTEEQNSVFATVGHNHVSVYEILKDDKKPKMRLKCAWKDVNEQIQKEESYYTCCWSIDIPGNRHVLCTGGEVGIIRILDVAQGAYVRNLYGHGALVNEIRAHPLEPGIIASSSKDQTVRLWHVTKSCCLAIMGGFKGHRDQVLSLDFSYCGQYIVSGSMDHTVKMWRITDEARNKIEEALGLPDNENEQEKQRRNFPGENDIVEQYLLANNTGNSDRNTAEDCDENGVQWSRKLTRDRQMPDPVMYAEMSRRSASIHYPCANTSDLHTNYVDCVRVLDNFIISKSSEDCIHVWKFGKFSDGIAGWDHGMTVETAVSHLSRLHHPNSDNWFVKFELDPRRKWIACGNKNGEIAFWRMDKGIPKEECDYRLRVTHDKATLRQISFDPFGRFIIAVGDDGSVSRVDRVLSGQDPPPSKKRISKRKNGKVEE